jgi:hypothetical protein
MSLSFSPGSTTTSGSIEACSFLEILIMPASLASFFPDSFGSFSLCLCQKRSHYRRGQFYRTPTIHNPGKCSSSGNRNAPLPSATMRQRLPRSRFFFCHCKLTNIFRSVLAHLAFTCSPRSRHVERTWLIRYLCLSFRGMPGPMLTAPLLSMSSFPPTCTYLLAKLSKSLTFSGPPILNQVTYLPLVAS